MVEGFPVRTQTLHTRVVTLGRVLIVDDESFTRLMLTTSLKALGFDVVKACANASCALETQTSSTIDVALLDLDLGPGPSGIDIAYALRAQARTIGIVFLTTYHDPRLNDPGERQIPTGSRYLKKNDLSDPETLRTTLIDARRDPLRSSTSKPTSLDLTVHQIAILRLVSMGMTNSEIAVLHDVSEKAVERTVQRISEALGLGESTGNRRVQLTRAFAQLSGKAMPGT